MPAWCYGASWGGSWGCADGVAVTALEWLKCLSLVAAVLFGLAWILFCVGAVFGTIVAGFAIAFDGLRGLM